jgi:hypothetical protein
MKKLLNIFVWFGFLSHCCYAGTKIWDERNVFCKKCDQRV